MTLKNRKLSSDARTGLLYVSPALLVLTVFYVFPIFFTSYVSLHKWRIKRMGFIGLANFEEIFGGLGYLGLLLIAAAAVYVGFRLIGMRDEHHRPAASPAFIAAGVVIAGAGLAGVARLLPAVWTNGDEDMLNSLRVTIWYSLGTVPVQIVLGLALAVLLDQRFKGKQPYRVVFLLPYIVPSVASATVFERLFSLRAESFANQLIGIFGASPLEWLGEVKGIFELMFGWGVGADAGAVASYWAGWAQGPSLALVSIMFFNYWSFIGYYALIYANGLANISRELYEAAEVDGAGKLSVLFKIVIPLLSPTTFFLTLLGIIGTFKAFNHIYVLRMAAARGAADPMSVYIFFTFFRRSRFGYAAALSLILFAIVLALTLFQRRFMERRVHYGE